MKKTIYLLLVLISFTACNDKLIEVNHSNTTQDFMKTPEGYKMGLVSAYSYMVSTYGHEGGIHGMLNPGTDEIKTNILGNNKTSNIALYDPVNYKADNEFSNNFWGQAYVAINLLNYLIDNGSNIDVTTPTLTPTMRDQYLGEAKFLRAYFYYHLVSFFGDVTLTTSFNEKPQTSADRHDMLTVYEVIISDLESAATLCADKPESGRASAAAARHLLAKTYLTLGWMHDKSESEYPKDPHTKYYDAAKARTYFQKAYDAANSLINESQSKYARSLMPNFADIFDEANDAPTGKNTEELFVARMDWDIDNSYGATSTLNHYYVNGYDTYLGERNINDGRCYSWNVPTPYTYEAFNNRDKDTRYASTFQTVWYATKVRIPQNNEKYEVKYAINGVDEKFSYSYPLVGDTAIYYPGYQMTAQQIRAQTENRGAGKNQYIIFTPDGYNGIAIFPTITKFLDKTRNQPNDNSDRSYIIFRLGETYLLAAEAAFKLNNKANAAAQINVLRERARNKDTSAAGDLNVTAADITLDFILEERTRELLVEHTRWLDLVRTGTLLTRVKKYNDSDAKKNIEEKHQLRPIPRSLIERITTGTPYPQNKGW